MKKIALRLLSLIYILYLLTIFGAHIHYRRSTRANSIEEARSYINRAISLNPINSAYRYQKYYLLKTEYENRPPPTANRNLLDESIKSLRKAIELEPAKASYHLYYALSLTRRYSLRDEEISHRVKQGLRRAVELKPFSQLYKEIYNRLSFKIERYHKEAP